MSGTLTESEPTRARTGRFARLTLCLQAENLRAPPLALSLRAHDEVRITRGAGTRQLDDEPGAVLELGVADPHLSTDHARLTRLGGRWLLEDRGSKNGTRVGGVREKRVFLADGDVLEMGHSFFVFRLDDEEAPLRAPVATPGLATVVPVLASALERLAAIAASSVPVVLLGESGTGKELLARAIHALSERSGKLVAVNCGALPEPLAASELFGARKGAFTGASQDRVGFVRTADRGTLLLDEIGDLSAATQAALLRVLQEGEVTPLGAAQPVPVDVRVVTATHRDLPALVASGAFRADLWARLSGFVFELPPLRHRREDLGLVIGALLTRLHPRASADATLALEAARALCLYDWPLNVRELEHALAGALALAKGGRIELAHLPPALREAAHPKPAADDEPPLDGDAAGRREELTEALRKHAGNLSAVARELGKDRKQIQRWVKRLGIDPDRYRL